MTKLRILGMIRDTVWAGLLPEQILETRLSEVIETATSTYLSALDRNEQATAKLYVQKAAQVADEAWLQTVQVTAADCHKPDHCILGTSQLRLPRGRQ